MNQTKAIIITIGDELLYGQTVDTNSAWIGRHLSEIGVQLMERIAIGDDHDAIVASLGRAVSAADVVLITGGLGPTRDDVTKSAIADFLHVGMHFSQETYQHISDIFAIGGREIMQAHREQCVLPDTVDLIPNLRGTAPGMWFDHQGVKILSMPGVPHEMQGIMLDQGLDRIRRLAPDFHIIHRILRTAGVGETLLADKIAAIVASFPAHLSIAYLPSLASVKLRVTAQGYDKEELEGELDLYTRQVQSQIAPWIYKADDKELAEVIGELCQEKGITIATAESCTGGLIAHLITQIPGASSYYEGSIISYSNDVKAQLLHVNPSTLQEQGAVSRQTVLEMVRGACGKLHVDVAVAVSGIAGPTGGTSQKPVGTVWIAVGSKDRIIAKKWQLTKNREMNIRYSAIVALNQLRLFILDQLDDQGDLILTQKHI